MGVLSGSAHGLLDQVGIRRMGHSGDVLHSSGLAIGIRYHKRVEGVGKRGGGCQAK